MRLWSMQIADDLDDCGYGQGAPNGECIYGATIAMIDGQHSYEKSVQDRRRWTHAVAPVRGMTERSPVHAPWPM